MGMGSTHWTGVTVTDLYSQAPTQPYTDYSNFVVHSADPIKSVGHGKIISRRMFTIQGNLITIQNTFSLGYNDSFVKIITQLTNNASVEITNVNIWTGTRDDYVGNTDVNTKTRGNLDTGSFVPITMNNQSSRAIMITNTNEVVLFYSETVGVMTAYALCCSFSNVYNTNPITIAPQTPSPTDGSYAAILPLGNVSVGASGSITWYYAAGAVSSLSAVAQTVAAAQVADASPSLTGSPTITPSVCASLTTTGTPTGTGSGTGTPTGTGSGTPSQTFTPTSVAILKPGSVAISLGDNVISGIIVINIVTAAVVTGLCFCGVCCFYSACLIKWRMATRCNYCKEELNGSPLSEHLKSCDTFAKENVKRAEVYKSMRAVWA